VGQIAERGRKLEKGAKTRANQKKVLRGGEGQTIRVSGEIKRRREEKGGRVSAKRNEWPVLDAIGWTSGRENKNGRRKVSG